MLEECSDYLELASKALASKIEQINHEENQMTVTSAGIPSEEGQGGLP